MSPIKVVFTLGPLDMGGTERQVVETIRRLNRARFAPVVLAFKSQGVVRAELERLGIPVAGIELARTAGLYHPVSYARIASFFLRMIRYFHREKPLVVHSYLSWTNILAGVAAKIAGVPILITGRRSTVDNAYMPFPPFYQGLEDFTNLLTSAVVANSQVVLQECLRRERFLSIAKTHVIYNGILPTLYQATSNPQEGRQQFDIPASHHIVGMLATLHPRKGHNVFLQAAKIIVNTHPDVTFLFIGRDTGIRGELEALTTQLDLRAHVRFLGERHDIPEMLALFDVQVSASFLEGLSNSLLEGMAAGNPVVATNAGGNTELVVPDVTGLIVPRNDPDQLANAIVCLLDNPDLRRRMGQAAYERVCSEFHMDRMIVRTEQLYEELLKGRRLGPFSLDRMPCFL